MKAKLVSFILLVSFWSCSGKYESESQADYFMEEAKTESAEIVDEYLNEEILATEPEMATKSKKTAAISVNQTNNQNFKNPLHYLADTLYLNSVRLSKKFILTANLRFKVKNVELSTRNLEKLALKLGGYIHQSKITNNHITSKNIEVSTDTVMEVTEYYVSNNMIIRVPSIYFDSVLSEISKEYVYLNHRDVKTEDVSTIFLRNKLKEEKRTEYEKRIQKAVDKAPRKLDDIVMAERQASDLADIAIDKKIDNYKLQDKIDFSTISMDFYQANDVYKEFSPNTRLSEYQPNFWQKAWQAIHAGWKAILDVIIGLLYIWPVYLIGIGIFYLIQFIRKRYKKN